MVLRNIGNFNLLIKNRKTFFNMTKYEQFSPQKNFGFDVLPKFFYNELSIAYETKQCKKKKEKIFF